MDQIGNPQNSDSMEKLTPEIYYDNTLDNKEKAMLFLLKLKIFCGEEVEIYHSLIKRGYIDEIPEGCRVLGKHVFLYHGTPKSIYLN